MSGRRLVIALLPVCLVLTGCSGSLSGSGAQRSKKANQASTTKVDAGQLEKAIAVSAEAQRHDKAAVICPSDLSVKAGAHFYCAAQAGGEVTPFLVTAGAGGKLSYRGVNPDKTPSVSIPQTEIAIAIAMRRDHKTARSVSCPQEMPRQRGLEFICVVTTAAKHPTIYLVRETNNLGRVAFRPR